MTKMNTINETAKLCKEHDIGISRNMIRVWAKTGVIPSVKIGRKVLINWEQLMKYLDTNRLEQEEPIKATGIRRISA